MSAPAPRYAIYFVPPAESALYRFGASVLGYDCYMGLEVEHLPSVPASSRAWPDLVREPQKYGFHATLKPPFRLPSDTTLEELEDALDRFAAAPRQVPTFELRVGLFGSFVALAPPFADEVLSQLAADCVTVFDRFRAPPSDEEWARRRARPLTAQHQANLERWGYPYVFESFRFHMTLTGPLLRHEREQVCRMLEDAYGGAGAGAPMSIASVSLLLQEKPNPFKIIGQWRLDGGSRL